MTMRSFAHIGILCISASIAWQVLGTRQMASQCRHLTELEEFSASMTESSHTAKTILDGDEPGVWVSVVPALEHKHKSVHVAAQLNPWFQWASGALVPVVDNFVKGEQGKNKFVSGLATTLIPQIQKTLRKSGIVASVFQPPDGPVVDMWRNGTKTEGVTFLIRIDGITVQNFTEAYLPMVRDGVINQMMVHMDGMKTLAEQLDEAGVPHAHVECKPILHDRAGLELKIKARKTDILNIAVPEALHIKHEANALTAFTRKLGLKSTKSAAIADTMKKIIVKKMQTQFLENGLETDIEAETNMDLNGKVDNGNKVVAVKLRIRIMKINPENFIKQQAVVLRDAVVEQLGGDDSASLEFQLENQNFPATVYFVKCGWGGPVPPADKTIKRNFRAQVSGCGTCGILDEKTAWPSCNPIWK